MGGKKRRTDGGAFMSSLYGISCFAAGLAGNLLSSSFLASLLPKILNCFGEWVVEVVRFRSPLQATSSRSPSSCRRCKLAY